MKKINLLGCLFILLSMTFTSCESSFEPTDLQGTWGLFEEYIGDYEASGAKVNWKINDKIKPEENQWTFELVSNNTFKYSISKLEKDSIFVKEGEATCDGEFLILDSSEKYEVRTLKQNELCLSIDTPKGNLTHSVQKMFVRLK